MKRIAILLLGLLFTNHLLQAQCTTSRYKEKIFDRILVNRDVQYGSNTNNLGEQQDLFMDVYMPDPEEDTLLKRPVILFVHGGAFVAGDKTGSTMQLMCTEFSKRGYVAIAVQYRLEKSSINSEPILEFADKMNWYRAILRGAHDVKGAIRYLKHSADAEENPYHIDTNNFTLYGSSAGAIAILHTMYLDTADSYNNFWKVAIRDLGGFDGNTSEYHQYGSTNTIRNLIVDSGAIGDKEWMGNNGDIDVLSFHHDKDPSVPYGFGCFYVAACHLGRFYGAGQYVPYLENLGARVVAYRLEGALHPVDDLDPQYVLTRAVDFMYDSQFKYDTTEHAVPTSVKIQNNSEIKIYPNPSRGVFTISTSEWIPNSRIQIFNLSGQLVWDTPLQSNQQKLQLDLQSGLYFVHIKDNLEQTHISKLIVQN